MACSGILFRFARVRQEIRGQRDLNKTEFETVNNRPRSFENFASDNNHCLEWKVPSTLYPNDIVVTHTLGNQ